MVSRMLKPELRSLRTSFWRISRTIPMWCDPEKNYFTTRYSEWNVYPPLRFWIKTTKHAI